MARKKRAYGTTLEYSTDGAAYTAVADVRLVSVPPRKRGPSDITHLESPAEGNEQAPGQQKCGQLKFEVFYDPARYATLLDLQRILGVNYDSTNPYYWRVKAPLGYGQATRDQNVYRGWLSEVELKELKNDDENMAIACVIEEAFVTHNYAAGA
jgi:hypothetical protein